MPLETDGIGSLGLRVRPPPENAWKYPAAAGDLAALVDLDVGPVRNQRQRNSCTSFACAAMLFRLTGGLIAACLALYYYFRKKGGFAPTVDQGAYVDDCMESLVADGAGSESQWPYGVNGEKYAVEPPLAYRQQAQDHKALAWYRALSVLTARSALAAGLPVGVGHEVQPNFDEVGRNGGEWVDNGGAARGGHMTCFRGYDDNHRNLDGSLGAFKDRNSWGEEWGDHGDFWVPYNKFPGTRFFDAVVVTYVDRVAGEVIL